MKRQLTHVFVCPYLESDEDKVCSHESDKNKINLYRTTKQFTDHLATHHSKEFVDRLVKRHGIEGQGKGQKAKVAKEDDMTPSRLKTLIRKELECPPDISKKALVWSGWFWKYRQVVTHNSGQAPLLNAEESGRLFRDWWAYGGPKESIPSDDKLLALATPYVHGTISQKLWPLYLHGGKGVKEPLVPPRTKRAHSHDGHDSESDLDDGASRQSDLDLDDAPPVVKESSAKPGRPSRKDKVPMDKEVGQPAGNISGGEDIAPES